MANAICNHGIPVTVPCGHCLAAERIAQLETELEEAKQYLRECRGLLGNILPAGMQVFLEDSATSGGADHG